MASYKSGEITPVAHLFSAIYRVVTLLIAGWWQIRHVLFHPVSNGEMILFDLRIFFLWVGSTTNLVEVLFVNRMCSSEVLWIFYLHMLHCKFGGHYETMGDVFPSRGKSCVHSLKMPWRIPVLCQEHDSTTYANCISTMFWGYPPPTNREIIICSFLWRAAYKPSLKPLLAGRGYHRDRKPHERRTSLQARYYSSFATSHGLNVRSLLVGQNFLISSVGYGW